MLPHRRRHRFSRSHADRRRYNGCRQSRFASGDSLSSVTIRGPAGRRGRGRPRPPRPRDDRGAFRWSRFTCSRATAGARARARCVKTRLARPPRAEPRISISRGMPAGTSRLRAQALRRAGAAIRRKISKFRTFWDWRFPQATTAAIQAAGLRRWRRAASR